MPLFGGLSRISESLWTAESTLSPFEFPKVSGQQFQNYRFGQFASGDRVRSPLRLTPEAGPAKTDKARDVVLHAQVIDAGFPA
jgi:hypothetical protein